VQIASLEKDAIFVPFSFSLRLQHIGDGWEAKKAFYFFSPPSCHQNGGADQRAGMGGRGVQRTLFWALQRRNTWRRPSMMESAFFF